VRLFTELRRRNVLRMAALYVVAAWLVMQVAGVLIDLGALTEQVGPWILGVLAIGFPIALLASWIFEITPEGVSREKDIPEGQSITHVTGRRMDFVIIAILSAGLIIFAYDKWWPREPLELSIAVLPFENMSTDPEQEYFSDGISEEILNLLAQIGPLKVIARTSSFSFKDKDVDIATIADQLDVRHVLEGSVRKDGDQVRITAQLIDASDSSHLWSQTYDRDLSATSLFLIQSDVARSITNRLRMTLTETEEERLDKAPTKNTEAYTAYLLGRDRLRDRKVEDLAFAVEQFSRAIELDPEFAAAYTGLADACRLHHNYSGGHVHAGCPAKESEDYHEDLLPLARRALSIDDKVGEAWVTLGSLLIQRALSQGGGPDVMWLVREAQDAYKKGIDLSPNFSQAYDWYPLSLQFIYLYPDPPNGWLTAWEDRRWQSVAEQGLQVDPLSLGLHRLKAFYPRYSSTKEEALAHARKMIEIAPDSPSGYFETATIEALDFGRFDKSILWLQKAAKRDPEASDYLLRIASRYCVLGDSETALAYLERARPMLADEQKNKNLRVLFIEACDLLLSGEIESGRLQEILQRADDSDDGSYLELRAMIDIRGGRAMDALSRYRDKDILEENCFVNSGGDLWGCGFEVMRVMEVAGDPQLARDLAEKRLKTSKLWFDRYPANWASWNYAQGLALLGRGDEAIDVLEARFGWRGIMPGVFRFTLEHCIAFDNIREHPRFKALVAATKADRAQQLENVRQMERNGEIVTIEELQAMQN